MTDSTTLAELRKRLHELNEKIRETEQRLPAHSVKPPVMHDLLALEDERDILLKEMAQAEGSS